MSKIDDGGTAFPSEYYATQGMTLRDYFAAAALQAFTLPDIGSLDPMEFARASYDIADAMIVARKEGV